jgi:hypothetical protein
MNISTKDIHDFFSEFASEVLHPDYYKGSWRVHFRGRVKTCPNYSTAKAWAMYFRRRLSDGWTASISKAQGEG